MDLSFLSLFFICLLFLSSLLLVSSWERPQARPLDPPNWTKVQLEKKQKILEAKRHPSYDPSMLLDIEVQYDYDTGEYLWLRNGYLVDPNNAFGLDPVWDSDWEQPQAMSMYPPNWTKVQLEKKQKILEAKRHPSYDPSMLLDIEVQYDNMTGEYLWLRNGKVVDPNNAFGLEDDIVNSEVPRSSHVSFQGYFKSLEHMRNRERVMDGKRET